MKRLLVAVAVLSAVSVALLATPSMMDEEIFYDDLTGYDWNDDYVMWSDAKLVYTNMEEQSTYLIGIYAGYWCDKIQLSIGDDEGHVEDYFWYNTYYAQKQMEINSEYYLFGTWIWVDREIAGEPPWPWVGGSWYCYDITQLEEL